MSITIVAHLCKLLAASAAATESTAVGTSNKPPPARPRATRKPSVVAIEEACSPSGSSSATDCCSGDLPRSRP